MTHKHRTTSSEITGTIVAVRAVEDSIRATGLYTEGIGTLRQSHPVQGEGFPSRSFVKYYEVCTEIDLDKKMPFWDAVYTTSDWLWGDTPRVDITFYYDYRSNKAKISIQDGEKAIKQLDIAIPGFGDALRALRAVRAVRAVRANGHSQ